MSSTASSGGRAGSLSANLVASFPIAEDKQFQALAWVSSICILFLAVGLIGMRPRKTPDQQPVEAPPVAPVLLVPAARTPPIVRQPAAAEFHPTAPRSVAAEPMPEVVPVVAATELAQVAFPVPVVTPAAIAPAARVSRPAVPSATVAEAAAPAQFDPAGAPDGGIYPAPEYPSVALRNGWQGTVNILIAVSSLGEITEIKVQKSSGYSVLDDAALEVVKKRWRFPVGPRRALVWPCVFRLR